MIFICYEFEFCRPSSLAAAAAKWLQSCPTHRGQPTRLFRVLMSSNFPSEISYVIMIRICKLSQMGILTESSAPATAEDGNRTRIIFSMTERKEERLSLISLSSFWILPHFASQVVWLSYLGVPLMNTSMCSNHEHLREKSVAAFSAFTTLTRAKLENFHYRQKSNRVHQISHCVALP